MEFVPRLKTLVDEVAELYGVELVDLEILPTGKQRAIRILIDQPGGVTHRDCAFISRKVGEMLDQKDAIPFPYLLEVSSPGINRPLTRPEHYQRFRGQMAEVELLEARDGRRRWKGRIEGLEEGLVRMTMEGDIPATIRFQDIRRAHLVLDPWEQHRKGKQA